jgi:hypothetical protein
MPIKTIDLTVAPGFIIHTCACCPCEHKVSLNRGGADTKREPYNIPVDSTLDVKVDGQAMPQAVVFGAGSFPDFGAVTAVQLRDKLNAVLVGATAVLNRGDAAVTIESDSTGPTSSIEIVGGTAREALKFHADGIADPCPGRAVLGRSLGAGLKAKDLICIRRCACGAQEQLLRTWDVCDPKYAGTHHYEHRRAVNALAVYFKAQGWLDPAVAADINAETSDPPDCALGLPGAVLEVPPPRVAAPGGGGGGA